jgi:hypothetical protein
MLLALEALIRARAFGADTSYTGLSR